VIAVTEHCGTASTIKFWSIDPTAGSLEATFLPAVASFEAAQAYIDGLPADWNSVEALRAFQTYGARCVRPADMGSSERSVRQNDLMAYAGRRIGQMLPNLANKAPPEPTDPQAAAEARMVQGALQQQAKPPNTTRHIAFVTTRHS
jgi:hypothetical protein